MKAVTVIACVILFVVFAVGPVRGTMGCTPQAEPAHIDTEDMTDFLINFDDLPFGVLSGPINISIGEVTVTLQGVLCKVANYYGLGKAFWNYQKLWNPDNDVSPGQFIGLGDPAQNSHCELVFSEPISGFSLRAASHSDSDAIVFAIDSADQVLNCKNFPFATPDNSYTVHGFNNSLTNNIKKIRIENFYGVADLVRGTFCTGGKSLIGGRCQFPDPCIKEPYPCDSNANCTNAEGLPQCMCNEYYQGEGTLSSPCTAVTCATASSYCNEHATCADQADYPFIGCTCNEGFTGTGFGAQGCMAVVPPSATPSSATGTPSTSTTPSGSNNTPNKKLSAGTTTVATIGVLCVVALGLF